MSGAIIAAVASDDVPAAGYAGGGNVAKTLDFLGRPRFVAEADGDAELDAVVNKFRGRGEEGRSGEPDRSLSWSSSFS